MAKRAELVFCSGDPGIILPSAVGRPRDDQLVGTPGEQLVEISGRICYDSTGTKTSRSSAAYHQHILESKHYSVLEHVHFTIGLPYPNLAWPLFGQPDVSFAKDGDDYRLTLNLRHVVEYPGNVRVRGGSQEIIDKLGQMLRQAGHTLAPQIVPRPENYDKDPPLGYEAKFDDEAFVSLWLEGSRVWSHEMVRHRHNMSQRSGRFCDETDREYDLHPDLKEYLDELGYLKNQTPEDLEYEAFVKNPQQSGMEKGAWMKEHDRLHAAANRSHQKLVEPTIAEGAKHQPVSSVWEEGKLTQAEELQRTRLLSLITQEIAQDRVLYSAIVDGMQPWLEKKRGLDKLAARKQARSAGRGFLAHALSTEMIFTASIRGWRDIFAKRCGPAADREIREVMEEARECVRASHHGHLL